MWGFDARDGNEQTRKIQSLRSSTYTLIFLSHTLRLNDLYIQIRSCGPSLPISLSVSLTGSAEIPGTRCQPPPCVPQPSTPHVDLSLSFSSTLSEAAGCVQPPTARSTRVCGGDQRGEWASIDFWSCYMTSQVSAQPVYSAFAASLPTLSNIRQIVCCERTYMLACLLLLRGIRVCFLI